MKKIILAGLLLVLFLVPGFGQTRFNFIENRWEIKTCPSCNEYVPMIPVLSVNGHVGPVQLNADNIPGTASRVWLRPDQLAKLDAIAPFSGRYGDLAGLPTLFSGRYSDLAGLPTLFSGRYSDLLGLPALGTMAYQNNENVQIQGGYADGLAYLNATHVDTREIRARDDVNGITFKDFDGTTTWGSINSVGDWVVKKLTSNGLLYVNNNIVSTGGVFANTLATASPTAVLDIKNNTGSVYARFFPSGGVKVGGDASEDAGVKFQVIGNTSLAGTTYTNDIQVIGGSISTGFQFNGPSNSSLNFGGIPMLRAPNLTNFFLWNSGNTTLTGTDNIFVGNYAGTGITTGSYNSAFGPSALIANSSGGENVAFGQNAGSSNQTGRNNTFIGVNAGSNQGLADANDNVFLGNRAGANLTGNFYQRNAFIGYDAGAGEGNMVGAAFFGSRANTLKGVFTGGVESLMPIVVSSTDNSAYTSIGQFLTPYLAAGNKAVFSLGKSISQRNSAELRYHYAGDNSTVNRLDIGFSNLESTTASFFANQSVSVGTNSESTGNKLYILGSTRIDDGSLRVYNGDIEVSNSIYSSGYRPVNGNVGATINFGGNAQQQYPLWAKFTSSGNLEIGDHNTAGAAIPRYIDLGGTFNYGNEWENLKLKVFSNGTNEAGIGMNAASLSVKALNGDDPVKFFSGNAHTGSIARGQNGGWKSNSYFDTPASDASGNGQYRIDGQRVLFGYNDNTFVGKASGNVTLTGSSNLAVGVAAGERLTTGSSNTFLGHGSAANNAFQVGAGNNIIGAYAGLNAGSGATFNNVTGIGQDIFNGLTGNIINAVFFKPDQDLTLGSYNVDHTYRFKVDGGKPSYFAGDIVLDPSRSIYTTADGGGQLGISGKAWSGVNSLSIYTERIRERFGNSAIRFENYNGSLAAQITGNGSFQVTNKRPSSPYPKLTTTERDALTALSEGDFIYNLTDHAVEYWNGTVWKILSTSN
jgi:hypothetical protein